MVFTFRIGRKQDLRKWYHNLDKMKKFNRITSGIYLAVILAFLGLKIAGVASYSWLVAFMPVIALIGLYFLLQLIKLVWLWIRVKKMQ